MEEKGSVWRFYDYDAMVSLLKARSNNKIYGKA